MKDLRRKTKIPPIWWPLRTQVGSILDNHGPHGARYPPFAGPRPTRAEQDTAIREETTLGTTAEALTYVDQFEATPPFTTAWVLDRISVLERLRELIRRPGVFHQKGLNACGPAAFFRIWLTRDPLAVAKFACSLLLTGQRRSVPCRLRRAGSCSARTTQRCATRRTLHTPAPRLRPQTGCC